MRVAQSGIFALGTGSHSYLEFDLLEHADPLTLVQAIANLREPRTTTGGVNLVVGFRPSLWRHVTPQEMPAAVTDFEQVVWGVDGYSMPATQHDLWPWATGDAYDKVFDVTSTCQFALISFRRYNGIPISYCTMCEKFEWLWPD
jgi:porphyrinogen peroxidase